MSEGFYVYIGPYVHFDRLSRAEMEQFYPHWDDGRYEAASEDDHGRILVPAEPVPGLERQMEFSRQDGDMVQPIAVGVTSMESNHLYQWEHRKTLTDFAVDNGRRALIHWGIVPCWR
jgi:hypothetical protein